MSEKEYKARCESLFAKNTVLLNQQKIDAEQIRALQKQNGELTDELALINKECKDMREELKQRIRENQNLCEQIEKMKCCMKCEHWYYYKSFCDKDNSYRSEGQSCEHFILRR